MKFDGIGWLDERVTVQAITETVDRYGQHTQVWSDRLECWARVRPPRASELVNAQQQKAALSYVVTMLARDWIDPTMRLLWQGRALGITGIQPAEAKQFMDLMTSTNEEPAEV